MPSNINPNNIDGAYPVAGQDNDSQGFRDNFTNTKTNFGYAAAEISDLQSKVVLKAALTGTTLNNNMGGSILSDAQLQDMSETKVTLGTQTGTITLNYAAGPYYTVSTSGSVTVSFTNFPPAGQVGRFRLQVNITNTAHTLILPAAVNTGTANVQGYSNSIITFNRTGTYEYEFESSDGGSSISIFDLNQNRDPIYLPSAEDLAPSAAVNLGITTSYFTTSAVETATMAAGVEGQIKVLAMRGNSGNALNTMTITVTNAAWGGSGTIAFNGVGQSAILYYIASKWFVISTGPDSSNLYPTTA